MSANTKKSTKTTATKKKREIPKARYRSFRLQKKIRHKASKPISGSFSLMRGNLKHIMKHKKLFFGIAGVYFILSIVLVGGVLGGNNISEVKQIINDSGSNAGWLVNGLSLFTVLLSGGSVSEAGSVYQNILFVVTSLVIIWAMRQTYSGNKVRVKQAFYSGNYPLVQFVLVVVVIALEFLPFIIGSALYGIASSQGIIATSVERFLWFLIVLMLAILTLYMVTSSIFALYIVTLPDLTPMKALRSARELVLHRRWTIMRKVLFMPLALFVLAGVIMIPIVLYASAIASIMFAFLTMVGLVVAHGYMYRLYRELL